MKNAIYYNNILRETYVILGIKNLEQAYRMVGFVCNKTSWDIDTFYHNCTIRIK